MAGTDSGYQSLEVKVVRGTEQRTITKRQAEGWELVDQQPGTVRSTLVFRRPKPPVPWKLVGGVGAGLVAILAFAGVMAVLEDDPEVRAESSQVVEEKPADEPEPVQPGTGGAGLDGPVAEILTVQNSPELASLLEERGACSQWADFAARFAGQTIQFDGHIGNVANVGTFGDRYNILLGAWDLDESNLRGPDFQYRDIYSLDDLNVAGINSISELNYGDRFRFTAIVDDYEPDPCMLLLEPVATEFR